MARKRPSTILVAATIASLLATTGLVVAQVERDDRGAAPISSSGSFEVSGVRVDTRGETAEAARLAGWRLAQRRGWQMLSQRLTGSPQTLPDGTLDSLVTGIVIENEQIGPTRYVARLGVTFNRARAASILGVGGITERSPALLVLPLQWSGGVGTGYERASAWQQAWARFRTGNSSIDYVRLSGTGPDSLLLNAGQVTRRGRGWWRTVLNQYGASDVLVPQVQLHREWPGGPAIATFTAGFGPDNRSLGTFALRVERDASISALLDEGVRRIDAMYQDALSGGVLRPDATLVAAPPGTVPPAVETTEPSDPTSSDATALPGVPTATLSIQAETPNAAAVGATEAALRGIPGVRSAITSSLALGGVSVLRVTFDGDPAILRAALEARGWQVQGGDSVLSIRRAPAATPATAPGPAPTG